MTHLHPPHELERAERNAVVGGVSVGVAVALLALVGPAVLIALSLFVIVLGILLSLTVIGLVIGLPLIVIGIVGIVGGVIGGSGGPVFALLLGIASGLLYYEHRVRKLPRR